MLQGASVWLAAMARLPARHPERLHRRLERRLAGRRVRARGQGAFAGLPVSDSIDYAVMESASPGRNAAAGLPAGVVLPLQAGWSDVGAWDALWQVLPTRTRSGNVAQGDVILQDSRNTLAVGRPPGGLRRRARCWWSSPRPTRCWWPTRTHAGRQEDRRHAQAAGKRTEASDPPQGASALGLVRQRRQRRAFPGQAHRRQSGGTPVAADAPPPGRALDRRQRHGQGDQGARRPFWCRRTNPPTSAGHDAPPGEPGPGARWR
jgi:hypothetical protein